MTCKRRSNSVEVWRGMPWIDGLWPSLVALPGAFVLNYPGQIVLPNSGTLRGRQQIHDTSNMA
ncbi:hypothetical protein BM221_001265 [Beauveria bassiana]|uniref:Uncharacterized protein n=1 Tax=Beauveria bassiana TaxID=176275 RepID=A0A2N6P2T0_BEABA|nr:hypothetical protein BM221_001265 [Beauveria bassiana]